MKGPIIFGNNIELLMQFVDWKDPPIWKIEETHVVPVWIDHLEGRSTILFAGGQEGGDVEIRK
jgi:hypothetical protein